MRQDPSFLGHEKIHKLLIKLSAPAMIGMLVQALYNITDAIFVGRGVGILAIAGISIVFPVQMIILALAISIGIGGASIISRSLGSGDSSRVEKTMTNIFSSVLLLSVLFSSAGILFIVPILKLFGATESILPYSVDYLRIILMGTLFSTFSVASNNIVRSEGNAKVAMYTMLISGGLNIILDAIFIFGLKWGVKGAAFATVISQAAAASYLLYYFISGKSSIPFSIKRIRFNIDIICEMFAIGISAFARQASASIMIILLNNMLSNYGGDLYIAVFGIINRLLMFLFMPMFGIVQGLQPIIGFNYGAGCYKRVREAIKLSVLANTAISTAGFLLLMFFPTRLFLIFTTDTEVIHSGARALRIIILAFPLVGLQIVGSGMYEALGRVLPSLVLSMLRQILLFIPLLLILSKYFQLTGIWFTFPVVDFLSAIVTFTLVYYTVRTLHK